MSDKKQFSYTPIIVGVIIALIGILTGFYIADNARQQLAVNQKGTDMFFNDSLKTDTTTPATDSPQSIDELPPLDPVVVDAPIPEVVEDSIQEVITPVAAPELEQVADTAKEPVKEPVKKPVKEPVKEPAKEPAKEPVKEPAKTPVQEPVEEPIEVDDFEEVPQEVIDAL